METTRGRSVVKVWCVMFRCLATKAVHIELTDSLDTDGTLMAITRLLARRGNAKEFRSDNGSNLRAADKELRKCLASLDQNKILSSLALKGIKWIFNSPSDPQAGGVWERAIRTAKDILRTILHEQRPRYEVLYTLLCEVERIMNSTPLFHVPVDPEDEDLLTPYHFLVGRASPSYPPGEFSDVDLCLRRRWRIAQRLADHFWTKWQKLYLPTVALRTKWINPGRQLQVGDIVVISDERHPRGVWLKGRVDRLVSGNDGVVRSAHVGTKLGTLQRPTRKLIVLDLIKQV